MFLALMNRREVRFKRECYAHAMTASTIINMNRTSVSDRVWSPFDFITKGEEKEDEVVTRFKDFVRLSFYRLPLDASLETCKTLRAGLIGKFKDRGREDAEEIVDSVYPHLKD